MPNRKLDKEGLLAKVKKRLKQGMRRQDVGRKIRLFNRALALDLRARDDEKTTSSL